MTPALRGALPWESQVEGGLMWSNRLIGLGAVVGSALVVAMACSKGAAPTEPSDAASLHVHDAAAATEINENSPNVASKLAAVRAATAKYHDIDKAIADGYQLGYHGAAAGCVSNPAAGAMGYHYFSWARMDDPSIVEEEPEVLVYHSGPNGKMVLGAVEWVVPRPVWEGAGNVAAPVVFGHALHVINPVLNWYIEHAWVWKHNPSGMFADWNPEVSCP